MTDTKQSLLSIRPDNEVLYLWIVALAIFMFGIWQQPFINFETRFAVFAQEMLRHGPSLFPTTYGQPYPDYPVTSTILIWLFSLPFGQVTKFSAVLPTALASATVIALTYQLFALYSKQWGFLAVCFELLTMTFLTESRSLSIDQMVSAITLSAFYVTHRSYIDNRVLPTKTLLLLLVAGFLIRGPIGVVLPTGVVLSHLFWTSERRVVLGFAAASLGVLIVSSVVQLGLAALLYGQKFAADIIRMQAVGRFADALPSPKYYYFTSSLGNYALSYPIAVIVAAGFLLRKFTTDWPSDDKRHVSIVLLLLAWAAIVFVGLSIPETKKARYILPAVPALAGLASYIFVRTDDAFLKWLRRGVELVLFFLPFLAAAFLYLKRGALHAYGFDVYPSIGVFFALFLANISLRSFHWGKVVGRSNGLAFVGVLVVLYTNVSIVEPIDLHIHDTSEFVHRIESLRERDPGTISFYKEGADGLPIKYLVNVKIDLSPEFVSDPEVLKHNRSPLWLLTKERNLDELSTAGIDTRSHVYRQRFGDIPFVALFVPGHAPMSPSPTTPPGQAAKATPARVDQP